MQRPIRAIAAARYFDQDSGEVLGIVNMVFVKSTKENVLNTPSGITYAIPVSHLHALLMDAR